MNITRITSAALVVLSLAACAEVQNNPKRALGISFSSPDSDGQP